MYTKSSGSASGLTQYIVVRSKALGAQTSSQKRGISMVLISAVIPMAARLACKIGAMATIAGNEDAIVIDVLNPSGTPASARSALALATSP